jgi:hypothetical protein
VAHDPDVYTLWSASGLPDLFGLGGRAGARGTLCLVDAELGGLALLAWSDESMLGGELCVLAPHGCDRLAHTLVEHLRGWVAAGRPLDDELEIRAYPRASAPPVAEGDVAIDQRWTRFVLTWSAPVRFV